MQLFSTSWCRNAFLGCHFRGRGLYQLVSQLPLVKLLKIVPEERIAVHCIANSIPNSGVFSWTPKTEGAPGTPCYVLEIIGIDTGEYQFSAQFGIHDPNHGEYPGLLVDHGCPAKYDNEFIDKNNEKAVQVPTSLRPSITCTATPTRTVTCTTTRKHPKPTHLHPHRPYTPESGSTITSIRHLHIDIFLPSSVRTEEYHKCETEVNLTYQ